jgi:POT family proton-dependent oligopeptide transporter
MSLGCLGVALANLVLVGAAWSTGDAGAVAKASAFWLIAYFALLTLGELYLSPIGLSLVSKVAPASILSMLMGGWFLTNFTGNFLAGYLGSLWSGMDKAHFFLMIAVIAGAASVAIWILDRVLTPRPAAQPANVSA